MLSKLRHSTTAAFKKALTQSQTASLLTANRRATMMMRKQAMFAAQIPRRMFSTEQGEKTIDITDAQENEPVIS